jgi:formiminotetrahydrofolate cyclodeaminase
VEKTELYAVIGGCMSVIGALSAMAYASVMGKIKSVDDQRKDDMEAVWDAIHEQRTDTKKILEHMITKDDLARSEDRLIRALRPGIGG